MKRIILKAGLVALIGWMPSTAPAADLPAPVAAAAATLSNMGYSEVGVSLRVFGGYALHGQKEGVFVTIALSSDAKTLVSAMLFRDLDGNGVFGQDESLGPSETRPLTILIKTALSDPASVAAPTGTAAPEENVARDVDIPGFTQIFQTLPIGPILQITASERLGVGTPVLEETRTEISATSDGGQDNGQHVTQVTSVAGLHLRDRNTAVSGSGVTSVTLSQVDVAAIRASVTSAAPDGNVLRESILASVPTSDSIRAGIAAPP